MGWVDLNLLSVELAHINDWTFIVSIVARDFRANTPYIKSLDVGLEVLPFLLRVSNSLALDWLLRTRIVISLNFNYLKAVPLP